MKCPVCNDTQLMMSEKSGVEIDYCPSCRGVWLDRGELDKILSRAVDANPAAPRIPNQIPPAPRQDYRYDDDDDYRRGYKKKKKNWLEEIFD